MRAGDILDITTELKITYGGDQTKITTREDIWRYAVEDGIVTDDQYDDAARFYGSMWYTKLWGWM